MDSRPNAKPCYDPPIDEVRERWGKLLEEHGNDLSRLFDIARKIQAEHPEKMIRRSSAELRYESTRPGG